MEHVGSTSIPVREPKWFEHRIFRDWLINHEEDRKLYADIKSKRKILLRCP
ncbi:GrpB family protein [Mediterraneibacter gnavus]|uniref:GrpB family protein n=1 Tax=Mediterraneibacter gnavus TaxID=33038 RepID=UPI0013B0613E